MNFIEKRGVRWEGGENVKREVEWESEERIASKKIEFDSRARKWSDEVVTENREKMEGESWLKEIEGESGEEKLREK